MGSSKTHRAGPSWQGNNTGAGKNSTKGYSDTGPATPMSTGRMSMKPQGDVISTGQKLREGLKAGTRDKSSHSRSSAKTKTSFGQS